MPKTSPAFLRKDFSMTDQKHRILVVGSGSIGERHLRCYQATGRAEVAVCELDADRCTSVADRYNIADRYFDVGEALSNSWSAVLIATPAHTHIPIAMQAAEAGNHLIIEKPLSTSLDGIEQLQALLEKKQLTAAISYQLRSHPVIRSMKEALASGKFGNPLQVYAVSGQNFPFYRPAYRDTYFADRRTGGGAIQDAITHMLNMSEWLVGPISRLCVDAQHRSLEGVSVEDTVHVLARHGDLMANYAMNMYQFPNDTHLTVVCEKATVRYEGSLQRWRYMTEPNGEWQDWEHCFEDRDGSYIANANAMLDVLEKKCEPLCSLEDALQTLRVNLAALRSAETCEWEQVG